MAVLRGEPPPWRLPPEDVGGPGAARRDDIGYEYSVCAGQSGLLIASHGGRRPEA